MIEALTDPAIRKQMTALGIDVVANTPEQFRAVIKADIPKWVRLRRLRD